MNDQLSDMKNINNELVKKMTTIFEKYHIIKSN